MRTLAEVSGLLHATARLAWSARWRLAAWYCLGIALHTLGLQTSAILGARHDLIATLAFVLGIAASLLSLIAMINTLRPGLESAALLTDDRPDVLPAELLRPEPFVALLTATLAPFLAVWSVWGLIEDEARTLFQANVAEQGLGGVLDWSISWAPERLPFYAVLLAGSWLVRFVLQRVLRRVSSAALAVLAVLAEAVVVFATFATLFIVGRQVSGWLATRVLVVQVKGAWRDLLAALPDLHLPFDLTLPRILVAAVGWIWDTALPALGTGVLLPLMWLALTAVVFGWRDWQARAVVAGTPAERLSRSGAARAARTRAVRALDAAPRVRALLLFASADLRTKYLPVLQALRLVLAAGPRVVGAFLVLATALGAAHGVLLILFGLVVGPVDGRIALALDPASQLLSGLLTQPLLIALYVATFDRALLGGLRAAGAPSARTQTARPQAPGRVATTAPGS